MQHPFRGLSFLRITTAAALIAVSAPLAASLALAQQDAVVATVNGDPVTETDLALAITDLNEQFAQLSEEQRRAAALSAIIEIRLMAAEAEKAGLADNDEFTRRMTLLRQRALHSTFIEKEISSSVTDETVRALYDKQIAEITPQEEVRARHILVKTEEEATAIIAELDAGGDFEALANEKSIDGGGTNGGDLGYFSAGRMVPEFETAAFALETGTYTKEPVQSQFGFHVIKVEDKRPQQPPAFEQVLPQLRSVLLREAYFNKVTALREAAAVEISDPALKEALEPAATDDDETADQ